MASRLIRDSAPKAWKSCTWSSKTSSVARTPAARARAARASTSSRSSSAPLRPGGRAAGARARSARQRGERRVPGLPALRVPGRLLEHHLPVQDVDLGVRLERGRRAAEVHPGREQDRAGRERLATLAEVQEEAQDEVATRRVPGEDDLLRGRAPESGPPHRAHVVQPGWPGVLGREPVVHREDAGAARQREPGQEIPDRPRRADGESAAVDVEHEPGLGAPSGRDPGHGHAGKRRAAALRPQQCARDQHRDRVELPPSLVRGIACRRRQKART